MASCKATRCHHRACARAILARPSSSPFGRYDLLQAVGKCIAYLKASSHSASAEERARLLDESFRPSYDLDRSELASSRRRAPENARGASASTQSCVTTREKSDSEVNVELRRNKEEVDFVGK